MMSDTPDQDGLQPYNPRIVDALVSIDPHLSDFEAGELVDRDGQPMHPVPAVEILSASPADIQQAKLILSGRRDTALARFEDIARLDELISPYDDGRVSLREILAMMHEPERAEAEAIIERARPGGEASSPDEHTRRVDYIRLEVIYQQIQAFIDSGRLRLHDGKPIQDPVTGEPLKDPYAILDAVDLQRQLIASKSRLRGPTGAGITLTADEAAAKLAELEERYPEAPAG